MNFMLEKLPGGTFVPVYQDDKDVVNKIPIGEMVKCEFIKGRNYKFHKLYFALLKLTLDNLPENLHHIKTIDNILTELKLRSGHYETIILTDGRSYFQPKSISFEKMNGVEFEEFFNKSVDLILKYYLKDTDRKEVIDQINQYL